MELIFLLLMISNLISFILGRQHMKREYNRLSDEFTYAVLITKLKDDDNKVLRQRNRELIRGIVKL